MEMFPSEKLYSSIRDHVSDVTKRWKSLSTNVHLNGHQMQNMKKTTPKTFRTNKNGPAYHTSLFFA